MQFEQELNLVLKTAHEAGEILRRYYGQIQNFAMKQDDSLVSRADHESETLIKGRLTDAYPLSEFIGEESGTHPGKEGFKRSWAVDPLDGTTNFIYGIPHYCISIGMQYEGEWILGVVYNPQTADLYHAVKGQGAFHNYKPIRVRENDADLSLALVGMGRSFSSIYAKDMSRVYEFFSTVRGVRSLGAAALDLARLAEGSLDLYFCKGLSLWDTAAAYVILTEAKAKICNFEGQSYQPEMPNIIAGPASLVDGFLAKKFLL